MTYAINERNYSEVRALYSMKIGIVTLSEADFMQPIFSSRDGDGTWELASPAEAKIISSMFIYSSLV